MSVEGKKLGSYALQASGSKTYHFPKDFEDRLTLLYFYPRDNTPGCTKQACAYRDLFEEFQNAGVQVFGVSKDSVNSHDRFVEKYQLTFPLLSDPERALATELEVTGRDSFLINNAGVVVAEWKKVSPTTTAQTTLETAKSYLNNIKEDA